MKLNLTEKITLERPVLELGAFSFPVDNTRDTVIAFDEKIEEMGENVSMAALCEAGVRHFLGDEAAQKLTELGLSVPGWRTVFVGVLALTQEITYEEAEARFLGEQNGAPVV